MIQKLVGIAGIEPARPKARDFKSRVSAYSTIPPLNPYRELFHVKITILDPYREVFGSPAWVRTKIPRFKVSCPTS